MNGRLAIAAMMLAVCSLAASLLMLVPTIYMLHLFDRVLRSRSGMTLVALSIIGLYLVVMSCILEKVRSSLVIKIGAILDYRFASTAFLGSFDSYSKGFNPAVDWYADLGAIRSAFSGGAILAVADILWVPAFVGALWLLHPSLAELSLIGVGLTVCVSYIHHQSTHSLIASTRKHAQMQSDFSGAIFRASEAAEALGMRDALLRRWGRYHEFHLAQASRRQRRTAFSQALMVLLQLLLQAGVVTLGSLLVLQGQLTIGSLVAANVLAVRALQPFQALAGHWQSILKCSDSYKRLSQLRSRAENDAEQITTVPSKIHIVIKNLVIKHDGRIVLRLPHAEFRPGEITVITGPSAVGKSALMQCVVGSWGDYAGTISINGRTLDGFAPSARKQLFGYLPQEKSFFKGTVAENIARFSSRDAEPIISAAKAAGVHDAVLRLPSGYGTIIDAEARGLPAGQCQKLALARALFGDPGVLVFDEPNVHLDHAGEVSLVHTLRRMREMGRTIIVVANRGAALHVADRIIHLDGARTFVDPHLNKDVQGTCSADSCDIREQAAV